MGRIDDFKANFAGSGARPNLFRVRGTFPNSGTGVLGSALGAVAGAAGNNLAGAAANILGGGGPARKVEFLCKAASLPASTIGVIEVPFRGRTLKVPGDRTYESWTITIINDIDFSLRNAFESWTDLINSTTQNTGSVSLYTIAQNWSVEQLGKNGEILKTYSFDSCWPSMVSAIDLAFDSSDQTEEFTAELQYSYFTSNSTT